MRFWWIFSPLRIFVLFFGYLWCAPLQIRLCRAGKPGFRNSLSRWLCRVADGCRGLHPCAGICTTRTSASGKACFQPSSQTVTRASMWKVTGRCAAGILPFCGKVPKYDVKRFRLVNAVFCRFGKGAKMYYLCVWKSGDTHWLRIPAFALLNISKLQTKKCTSRSAGVYMQHLQPPFPSKLGRT